MASMANEWGGDQGSGDVAAPPGADQGSPAGQSPGEGGQRKRLQLKPRSAEGVKAAAAARPQKSNPFGAARPREEILKSKGVDASALEKRIEAKTRTLPRMNKEQTEEYEGILGEHKFAVAALEKATTDEDKAKQKAEVDAKKKALDEFVATIRSAGAAKAAEGGGEAGGKPARPRFERPSERRRRQEERDQARGGGGGGGGGSGYGGYERNEQDDAFSSFGRRGGGGGRRGGGGGGDKPKLYVGNLSYDAQEGDLAQAFSQFGEITDIFLPTERETGRPRGFGFVTFASMEQAQAAVAAMDGQSMDGRNIKVNMSDGGGGGGGGGRY